MKLFFWDNILKGYTNGMAFALANDENEARQLIIDKFVKENEYISDRLVDDLKVNPIIIDYKFGAYCEGGE